ncbi:MAG TPA: hemolysin III family protein, partial [Rudaea sp.]|nr:hemolysin III family protein [Rudaea sp.]
MSANAVRARYTLGEELANSLTHACGLVLSIAGLVVLVSTAALRGGDASDVVSCAIYGVTLIVLYTSSTLYHSAVQPERKRRLRIFDHLAIFLLI